MSDWVLCAAEKGSPAGAVPSLALKGLQEQQEFKYFRAAKAIAVTKISPAFV